MKTFFSFVTGVFTGALAFATLELYCMRTDEDYTKCLVKFAGYENVFLIKSKKENEAK
jgi:hypothetical protein|nr:MAG TPA: hypothetical protein [Caudoviricetes sp.]